MREPGNDSGAAESESIYAVSLPPAMYARDVLEDEHFATAMGYGWLHEQDTEFVRTFKEQVRKQAEIYEKWLAGEDDAPNEAPPAGETAQPPDA